MKRRNDRLRKFLEMLDQKERAEMAGVRLGLDEPGKGKSYATAEVAMRHPVLAEFSFRRPVAELAAGIGESGSFSRRYVGPLSPMGSLAEGK